MLPAVRGSRTGRCVGPAALTVTAMATWCLVALGEDHILLGLPPVTVKQRLASAVTEAAQDIKEESMLKVLAEDQPDVPG